MDFIKQYIVQCISAASNNLRLSAQNIEVVALLRETIINSENIESEIKQMKKITELSTLAIRLNEIYNYLTSNHIDLFKLSDKFKDHSQYLIKDLNSMLETVSLPVFQKALTKLNENNSNSKTNSIEKIDAAYSKGQNVEHTFAKSETEILKEKIIFEEDKDEEYLFFQNYETEILKPIKPIDAMLKKISGNEINPEEINNFAKIMKINGDLSAKIGFDIIANMHNVISKSLLLIKTRELMPGRDVIESMRACLIVIVAVVRGKEVDITNYLNRAEEFGRKIQNINIKLKG
ncbi:MAG TPA: hypothetical protein VKA26_08495 [Ignavibacteriaceae bacterium]|nr:hypothetical protein [Ignavibacteriaceae bacterium]